MYGCSNADKEYTRSSEIICDSIILNNIDTKTGVTYNAINNSLVINYFSKNGDKVFTYNVQSKSITDSISIDPKFLARDYFIAKDRSIFSLSRDFNTIYSKTDTGAERTLHTKDVDSVARRICALAFPFQIIDNGIVLYSIPQYHTAKEDESKLYFKSKILAYYQIDGDSLVKKSEFGSFPDFYVHNFYYEFFPIACRVEKDIVYYMFSNDNILYSFNISTNETKQNYIKNLDKNNMMPFDNKQYTDLSFAHDYQVKVPSYVKLLHDVTTNEIVVFQSLEPKKNKDDSKLQLYTDKPLLVNVIDTALNVSKKIYFDGQSKIFFNNSFYHNGYLYIQERASGENELKVYVYKIR